MVSALEPVIQDGRHLLSAGHDVLLRDLIQRTLSGEVEGTYNILFSADGRLIAHPRFAEAIQAQSGALTIADTDDPHLQRVFELAQSHPSEQIVVENDADAEFLAISQLSGPGWYLVTVFPKALVANQAFDTAGLILLLGAGALLLEIGILSLVLKRQVAAPLQDLIAAARRLASGRFDAALEVSRSDEIGQLARSFNTMAQEINAREAALHERSARLAEVNAQLEHELAERLRAEEEVARQRETLHQNEKLNALGTLLAGVAHELNNPLSVVVGRASLLADELRNSPQAASLAAMRSAAERCGKIIRTFVALARQEQPSRRPVGIAEVIDSTLEVVSFGFRRHQIEVRLELEDHLPEISADPNQLVQVFANLLINAQQVLASCPAPRQVQIGAAVDQTTRTVIVRVEDNGPGIPQEIVGRIFDPFFTTKPVGQGTGLGLSLCRGLIEAHSGTIEVHLPEGGGTIFEVCLPVEASLAPLAQAELRGPAPPRGREILIVDDEPEIAEMLAEVLAPLGCHVQVCHSGRVALDRLGAARFDLVLTDIRMPDVDGQQLYRELVAADPKQAARVVFISGDTLSDAMVAWVEETSRPVIEKPFAPDDVRRLVALELRRWERRSRATEPPAVACKEI
jgi:signal transduction histidine kinase/ActR/RegA family two-component response regulator